MATTQKKCENIKMMNKAAKLDRKRGHRIFVRGYECFKEILICVKFKRKTTLLRNRTQRMKNDRNLKKN